MICHGRQTWKENILIVLYLIVYSDGKLIAYCAVFFQVVSNRNSERWRPGVSVDSRWGGDWANHKDNSGIRWVRALSRSPWTWSTPQKRGIIELSHLPSPYHRPYGSDERWIDKDTLWIIRWAHDQMHCSKWRQVAGIFIFLSIGPLLVIFLSCLFQGKASERQTADCRDHL